MIELITNLIYGLLIINTIAYTYKLVKNTSRSLKNITAFLWGMLLVEVGTNITSRLFIDNLILSHAYYLILLITLSLLYKCIIENKIVKRVITIVMIVLPAIFAIQYLLKPKLLFEFNIFEILSCSLVLVFYAITYLYQCLDSKHKNWILFSSGLIIFLTSSSIVFASGNAFINQYIEKIPFMQYNFWMINNVIYLILQILISVEWLRSLKGQSELSPKNP